MATQQRLIEHVFEAARGIPREGRPAFLDRACKDAPDLRQGVEQLLQAEDQAAQFFQDVAAPLNLVRNGVLGISRFRDGDLISKRFLVVKFIARGGMGEVYEVADQLLHGTHVALKIIRPDIALDSGAAQRFEREVLLARKIVHPNLCPIYDIGSCHDVSPPFLFLTMKMLDGETLSARLDAGKPSPAEAVSIARQLMNGVDAIHDAGIIHRDIKPNNVMLDGSGAGISVTLMDFGLARLHEPELTLSSSAVAGTPGYIAPELFRGASPSRASDIYALGVLLHEVFTGKRPPTHFIDSETLLSPPASSTETPRQFTDAVRGFLAEQPDVRLAAFERLKKLLEGGQEAREAVVLDAPRHWTRRKFAYAATGAACLIGGGAVWKRERIYNLLHPIPGRRFVAVLGWPPSKDSRTKPLVMSLIDSIANELSRAEAFDHNLFVAAQRGAKDITTAAQLNETRESLGANLILAASGAPAPKGMHVLLQVLDPSSSRTLRASNIRISESEQFSLPERVVRSAAELLDIDKYELDDKRLQAGTANPAALTAFEAAEASRKLPNDTGLEAAIDSYKQAVDLDTHYATAYARLAQAYIRLYALHGDPAALSIARNNTDRALALAPNSVPGHIAMASLLEHSGDRTSAARELEKALSFDPANTLTLVNQGQMYTRANRWQEAEDTFNRVLKLRPNLWLAHNELGYVFVMQGKYQQALSEFREASLASPKNALSLNNIGDICLRLGRVADAKEALAKSLALHPNDLASITMAAACRSEGRLPDAIRYARAAVELNPAQPTGWLELGDCYWLVHGKRRDAGMAYAKMAPLLEESLRTNPADGPAWILLALCKIKTGAPEEVLHFIENGEKASAGDIDSQLYKARTLELLGQRDEALKTFSECLKRGATQFQIQSLVDMESLRNDARYAAMSQSNASKTETKYLPGPNAERT